MHRPLLALALSLLLLPACGGGEPAAPTVDPTAPAPVTEGTVCERSCRNFDRCGLQAYAQCLEQCADRLDPSLGEVLATMSCEDLLAVATGSIPAPPQ